MGRGFVVVVIVFRFFYVVVFVCFVVCVFSVEGPVEG